MIVVQKLVEECLNYYETQIFGLHKFILKWLNWKFEFPTMRNLIIIKKDIKIIFYVLNLTLAYNIIKGRLLQRHNLKMFAWL
jgi:hypothetical protein